jgi:hypothetical protein
VYRAVEDGDGVLAHNGNPPNARCPVSCAMRGRAHGPCSPGWTARWTGGLGRTTVADLLARVARPNAATPRTGERGPHTARPRVTRGPRDTPSHGRKL